MEQPGTEVLPIKQGILLDLLETNAPALSANSDMPVIETKPDSSPPAKEAAAPEEAELTDESATSATEEQPGADPEVKKPPKGVQKRLDELTRQREEAKELYEAEKAEKLRLMTLLENQTKVELPPETVEEPARPSRADYVDDNAFMDAVSEYVEKKADFLATKRQAEAEKQRQETEVAEGQRIARETYLERVQKTQEQYADFKEVAERPDVMVSIPMAHAIVHHEQGPAIQYYLGKNPADAKRIANLDIPSQLVELGVIVATKLTSKGEEPKPKPVSAAPRPLSANKPSETPVVKDPSTMNMEEYKAWRKSGGRT